MPFLGHSWRAVLITQIRDVFANRRRRVLLQSSGRIEVLYEILCEDQATADLVSETSSTTDLTAALHAEGLTNVTSAETTVLVEPSPPPSSDSGIDVSIVAGAAAGGAAFVLAVVAVCWWLRRKRTDIKVMMNPAVRRRNQRPVVVVMAPS